ncbi:MAG: carbamoyl phosphate synthase small subunit [Oscillospiraceae bacterium]|jgi:carbamoyl-phosphate synthase small subunit|nr:carbamoyl phosphate synthase small subunit [Oscillospiraceae bacterium]
MPDRAYLVLEDGAVFEGRGFGAEGDVVGEAVFTTGMTGYLETLTDKSYYGQIVTQTFPLIGNYGVIPEDFESDSVAVKGYIVRQWCQEPSNFRSRGDLDAFLRARGVVGLCGIDTRRLTKIIRERGVMNAMITRRPDRADMSAIRDYRISGALAAVSSKAPHTAGAGGRYSVALMDYGLKENIKRELLKRGCDVTVFPHDTPAGAILASRPDGIMLSNGPGDPRDGENAPVVSALRELCASGTPMFGICLGHQLLALAHGFGVEKLKYGHRGANQPAKELTTGKTYITSQNHGYAVVSGSIDGAAAGEWFVNVNDGTNEGIIYKSEPIFSVQFHPEAASGPRDTSFLFDRFTDSMGVKRNAAR